MNLLYMCGYANIQAIKTYSVGLALPLVAFCMHICTTHIIRIIGSCRRDSINPNIKAWRCEEQSVHVV